jgi:hypothetical protein
MAILTRERVRIITFNLYPTHMCQILDVVLFSILKKHATGLETGKDCSSMRKDSNEAPVLCSRGAQYAIGESVEATTRIEVWVDEQPDSIDLVSIFCHFDNSKKRSEAN